MPQALYLATTMNPPQSLWSQDNGSPSCKCEGTQTNLGTTPEFQSTLVRPHSIHYCWLPMVF